MRELGYGRGYEYAHDTDDGVSAQRHLPDNLAGRRWYRPTTRGFEAQLSQRLERIQSLVKKRREIAEQ
jgi:putative ATPase